MRIPFTTAALALGLAFAPAAFAADVRPPIVVVPFSWTGHYVGINAGYAWGVARYEAPPGGVTAHIDMNGWLAGVTVGGNKQGPNWVIGWEGDFARANISGSGACPNATATCTTTVDWLATLRGRLGRAHDRTLYYAHLGLAFAPVHIAIDFPPGFAGTDRWRAGGAAGVGVEHAFSNNLTFKVEWLYIGMELFRCPVGLCDVAATAPDGTDVRVSANILRLGINRKF